MSQQFVADRIENEIIILISQADASVSIEIPSSLFPEINEGDILTLQRDDSAAQKTLDDAQSRLDRLKSASPQPSKGDIIDL